MTRAVSTSLVQASVLLVLTACSSGDPAAQGTGEETATGPVIVQPGLPGEPSRTLSQDEAETLLQTEATPTPTSTSCGT